MDSNFTPACIYKVKCRCKNKDEQEFVFMDEFGDYPDNILSGLQSDCSEASDAKEVLNCTRVTPYVVEAIVWENEDREEEQFREVAYFEDKVLAMTEAEDIAYGGTLEEYGGIASVRLYYWTDEDNYEESEIIMEV